MKKVLIGLFILATIPAFSGVKDVGVIGPEGEILLYYREGNRIVVKACDPYTVLGMTPAQARSNCQGNTNKIPVEYFKQSIRNLVSTDRLNMLKPLTPEEVEAYSKDLPSSDQIEAMVIELEKINHFIAVYGAENANLVRREELVKALRSQETRASAIKKINAEVEKAVNLIADQTNLTLAKFNSDKDQFLYTVLKQFNPNQKFPCGLKGSVNERIKDCSNLSTSEKEGFVLVTRSKDFKEVHMEVYTGRLWSDRLPSTMTISSAKKACKATLPEVAGISGVTWRLPSIDEYKEAEKKGIRKALPNMNYWFWSSSQSKFYTGDVYMYVSVFDTVGDDLIVFKDETNFGGSVRCIAR